MKKNTGGDFLEYHYDPSTESIKDNNRNIVIDEVPPHIGDMLAELMTKTQWPACEPKEMSETK